MKTRIVPVIMLAVLSPLTAEFLLGDQYLQGLPPAPVQIVMFLAFVAFYGMAAVLIRELGRRLRVGWPGLLLLALGYGIFEEGLITQTLFNPHYLGLDLLAPGHIAALGMGAPWTVFVISLHVVWSICTPIAIVEAWYGSRRPNRQRNDAIGQPATESWLGPVGVTVCIVVLLIGAAGTFAESTLAAAPVFLAHPGQLIGAAVAAALAVVGAITLLRRDRSSSSRSARADSVSTPVRQILAAAVFGVLATSVFQAANRLPHSLAWLSFAGMLLVWLIALLIMNRWRPVAFGVAAGAVLTYAWVGMLPAIRTGTTGAIIEQSILILTYLLLLTWTTRRLTRQALSHV